MFAIEITRVFCAAHALRFPDGTMEPLHGHNWEVVVEVRGARLDALGTVMDFHDLEARLEAVLKELHNRNVNDHAAFAVVNPSAEEIARYLADRIGTSWQVPDARLYRVTISEAPGCRATYWPDGVA